MPCSISSIRNVASLSSVSGATSSERLVPGCAKQISLRACALTKTYSATRPVLHTAVLLWEYASVGALQHLMLSGCATEQNKTPGRHRTICTLTTQSHCLGNPSGRPDADCAERARLRSTKLSVPSRTGSTDSADVAPTAGLVDGIADSLTAAQRVRPASESTKQWRRQGAVCPPQYVVCPLPAELTAASGAARGSSSGNNNLASI